MNIDSYYTIGQSHRVCQDYAIHNEEIVIVADGCSSAPNSDVGARILTHALLSSPNTNWRDIISKALEIAAILHLPASCLCSTVLTLTANDEALTATMIGDGTIFSRRRNSGEEILNLEFVSGAPYYLYYELNMKDDYLKEFGDRYKINGVEQSNGFFEDYPLGMVVKEFSIEDYDMVAIFSDGLNSFQQKTNTGTSININPYPAEEVIKEVMAIKGFAGSFVQRRCKKALEVLREAGCVHTDDFSMGVIKI